MSDPRPSPASPDAGMDPLLVFIHIRKTAGYSLRKILQRQFGTAQVRLIESYHTKPDRSEASMHEVARDRGTLRVVHGHMLFRDDVQWPEGTKFFTMLRDPVERAISHYYWTRARSPKFKLSLEEAVTSKAILDNQQVRVLSASDPPFGEMTPELLDVALANLDRFSVVGLTERFDESLVLLTRTFGWRRTLYERMNVTRDRKPREEVSPEALELIRQHNALDIELYHVARERFERDVVALGEEFQIEVQALKRANAQWTALGDNRKPPSLPPVIVNGDAGPDLDLRELLIQSQADLLVRQYALEDVDIWAARFGAPKAKRKQRKAGGEAKRRGEGQKLRGAKAARPQADRSHASGSQAS